MNGDGTQRSESDRASAAVTLTVTSVAAGAAFALLTRAVRQRQTAAVDRRVHPKTRVSKQSPARDGAEIIGKIGKWWLYVPIAYTAASLIARDRKNRVPLSAPVAIAVSATAAAVINEFIDELVPQPPAPPGRPTPDHPVYPSGHAFGTTAVAFSLAWVLIREGRLPSLAVVPLTALLPFISAGARMAEEKHWISDVAGGILGGVAVAALPLAIHEALASVGTGGPGAPVESAREDDAARSDSRRSRYTSSVGRKAARNRIGSQ